MRTIPSGMQALLDQNTLYKCNLYTFTLLSGETHYWTDADIDVVVNSTLYHSDAPGISGFQYTIVRGLQVDTLELVIAPRSTDVIAGIPWHIAARSGVLNGASMVIQRAFLPAWGIPGYALELFSGSVDSAPHAEMTVTLNIISDAAKLNTLIPIQIFQPTCLNSLYKPGCDVAIASYTFTGTVGAVSSIVAFDTSMTQADGYFQQGRIIFNTGNNSGSRRGIKSYVHTNGHVELSNPLEFDIQTGDTFTIIAGCNKLRDDPNGCQKFSNQAKFRAFPYTPKPETVIAS
jgi:uncharacterized phage protein (TIGR02218 family)